MRIRLVHTRPGDVWTRLSETVPKNPWTRGLLPRDSPTTLYSLIRPDLPPYGSGPFVPFLLPTSSHPSLLPRSGRETTGVPQRLPESRSFVAPLHTPNLTRKSPDTPTVAVWAILDGGTHSGITLCCPGPTPTPLPPWLLYLACLRHTRRHPCPGSLGESLRECVSSSKYPTRVTSVLLRGREEGDPITVPPLSGSHVGGGLTFFCLLRRR